MTASTTNDLAPELRQPESVSQYDSSLKSAQFGLPLVSIIVINFNYARFLMEAVSSALSQTYSNIELIVVDDASTDESALVLDEISRLHPEVRVIRRDQNGGQSLATRTGFEASSGDHVVFLDADDVLLPTFVETHVFVHLSLRIPVGFTSSDMAQSSGHRFLTGTLQYFSDYIRSGAGKITELTRPIDMITPGLWSRSAPQNNICASVHWVPPTHTKWVWAPTSGNCFRRDAVAMFIRNQELAELRSCTDAYLIRSIAAITGSVLIDKPLAIYRFHGQNVFGLTTHLNGTINYDRQHAASTDHKARRMTIDYLLAEVETFNHRIPDAYSFLKTLKTLDSFWPPLPSPIAGCRTYTGAQLMRYFPEVAAAIGRTPLIIYSLKLGISPWRLFLGLWATISPLTKRR